MRTKASESSNRAREEDWDEAEDLRLSSLVKDHVQTAELVPTSNAALSGYPARAANAPVWAHRAAPAPKTCRQKKVDESSRVNALLLGNETGDS